MNIVVNLLFIFLSTDTFKVLIKKGTRKIIESKGVSIDKELATALLTDIAESNGNSLTEDIAETIIKEL